MRARRRVVDVAFDQPDLLDVRERQVRGCWEDLDGTGGDPAVAVIDFAVCDWGVGPGQRVEGGEQAGLIVRAPA